MEQRISSSFVQPRFQTLLLGIFAGVALLLTAVGLYGVLAYSVTRRTHEIGIRMALGARRSDVLKLIVRNGLGMTLLGMAIGLVGAFAVTRLISTLLFGVTPTDKVTFITVSAILIVVALLACYLPARRATKVDPLVALRYE
jgi:putative ABC transport system permease protein